jgi:spermidine/putrescine-binding protein
MSSPACAPHDLTRRQLLHWAMATGLLASTGGLVSCSRGRYIDVLAPPSTLRPQFLHEFFAHTGVHVRAGSWVSPTDALGKLFASSVQLDMMVVLSDLFTPVVPEAIARGLLTPIKVADLPDARHIAPQFFADMFSSADTIYAVPVYWGFDTVLFNRRNVPATEPLLDSWGLIFDDKFKGRVSLKDDAHESIMPTALYMGHKRPLEMDRADLKEVTRFLISKKSNFRALWSKFAEAVQLMATGEVNALYGYPLMQQTLRLLGMDVGACLPKEGLLLFVQSACIPRHAAYPREALQWIQFLLGEDIATRLTREAAVLSPSFTVRQRFSIAEQRYYGYDALTGSAPLVRLGRPEHLEWWIEAWSEFKAA